MKKYLVKFQRDFEVEIEADTVGVVQGLARNVLRQFPEGTCKLLSITREGYVDKPCIGCQEDGPLPSRRGPPDNKPLGGGSPGTPTVRVPELVDQIAKQEAA